MKFIDNIEGKAKAEIQSFIIISFTMYPNSNFVTIL